MLIHCPTCGSRSYILEKKEVSVLKTIIIDYPGYKCCRCSERYIDSSRLEEIEKLLMKLDIYPTKMKIKQLDF